MLNKLVLCLFCVGLGGLGCRGKPEDQPACPPVGGGKLEPRLAAPLPATAPHFHVARRDNGDLSLISADGKQVIVMQPGGYQVCEPAPAGDSLLCGPLTEMSVACPNCLADPCPCHLPICKPGCSNNVILKPGSASPGTP